MRPDIEAVGEIPGPEFAARLRLVLTAFFDLEGEHRAEHARPRHVGPVCERAHHGAVAPIDLRDARHCVLLFVQAERGERDRASERIGGEGMAVGQRAVEVVAEKQVEQAIPRHGRRKRHVACGQPLRKTDKVGHDVGLLQGEQRAGAPEARRHLIENHNDSSALRGLDETLEEARAAEAHAGRALHQRLDDERRDRGPRSASSASKADSAPASRSSAASSPSKVAG